ncbi:MAG TPA: isoleucine--tRNA ligase [Candidatus Nanoperiomorbaceae bacterium]|nr:isoleucine--tRNA ligase [Candidatus Nanoperiomorbaceae bacterium]HMU12139.1 isoleucine--tRNA ligase [Candidatus Nanoperiomorbaceae bacterium]
MKFKHGTRRRALEYEKEWVQRWKADGTFEKSVENRSVDNAYVFYDGPPFITGNPHHGTLLSSIVKDAVPRYWTMKGKRVERVWGWDCHGLPAENFVEKQLNITDRRQIVTSADQAAPLDKDGNELPTVTLEHYITKARESMVANSATWEGTVDRIGRWVDFQGAYKTMDKNFMESVWWAFKTLYEQGKIYEGEKVLMYDTKFATPVSKNEVTMDNDAYQTVTDPSVYVKFKLKDGRTILAWTTTPWTLPGNTALAVNENLDYVEVKIDGDQFILAKDLVEKVLQDEKHRPLEYEVIDALKGKDLVGQCYEPLFEDYYLKPAKDSLGNYVSTELLNSDINGKYDWSPVENAYKIWAADYVSSENGTGIVHLAPIYGEEDFALAVKHNIPRLHVLDDNGYYYPKAAAELYRLMPWVDATKPLEVWESNKNIAKGLEKAGIVWKTEYIRHEYPFNPRSKQRIMYRAIPSWFFDVQGSKPLMLEQNEHINWFPEHLKHGRFAKNIEQAPDWNLSRDRFWATAMPVWKGDKGTVKVVGSYAELKELSGVELDDYHRPWVDDITFEIDGEEFTRIEKVLDCWFESGSMPFAQFHYPFENKEKFEANFPGDFIVEYVGQVRAWFYYVHTVNTALFGENAFKNVITTGVVAGNDGRKMSKSLGNYTDPNELMDKFSADSLRFLLLGSPLLSGEDFALQDKDVSDTARKLSMIWNMYDFFTMYAEVDGWEYDGTLEDPLQSLTNPLDIWIVSRVHQLVTEIEKYMDAYNIPDALSPILPFLDDASNWYVRRSRRRFWKSEDDSDKNDAYKTLHYVLVRLSYVLAPFTPFLAEELYHNLTGDTESIHLKDWLSTGGVDQTVVDSMETTKEAVNLALSIRAQNSVKIRQPLGALHINTANDAHELYLDIIEDEVNVKSVQPINPTASEIKENLIKGMKTPMYGITSNGNVAIAIEGDITPELKREGLMREVVRYVQNARKQAGLNVDDRIVLQLTTTDNELQQAIAEHQTVIKAECLASFGDTDQNSTDVKVDGAELQIALNVQ